MALGFSRGNLGAFKVSREEYTPLIVGGCSKPDLNVAVERTTRCRIQSMYRNLDYKCVGRYECSKYKVRQSIWLLNMPFRGSTSVQWRSVPRDFFCLEEAMIILNG